MRHDIVANHTGAPRSMWAGGAAEFRRTVRGPAVVVGASTQDLFRLAVIAASVWNQYLPAIQTKMFNVTAADLPGNTVGQIWIPCPNDVCNLTIDPSYGAPVNVLIHEMGHGLGLPTGSVSGLGSYVNGGNHWVPEAVDPREIMTPTIHEAPYISMYTIRAMDPYNHTACRETFECSAGRVCYPTGVLEGPGACDHPGGTIIERYHYPEYGWEGVWAVLLFIALLGGTVLIAVSAQPAVTHKGAEEWW